MKENSITIENQWGEVTVIVTYTGCINIRLNYRPVFSCTPQESEAILQFLTEQLKDKEE
jgi:hypothetical protein